MKWKNYCSFFIGCSINLNLNQSFHHPTNINLRCLMFISGNSNSTSYFSECHWKLQHGSNGCWKGDNYWLRLYKNIFALHTFKKLITLQNNYQIRVIFFCRNSKLMNKSKHLFLTSGIYLWYIFDFINLQLSIHI